MVAVPNRDLQQLLKTNFSIELTTWKQSTDEPCEVLRLHGRPGYGYVHELRVVPELSQHLRTALALL